MNLGISSYTYAWAMGIAGHVPNKVMSAFELLEKAVQHGVNRVQIADNLPLHGHTFSELKAIKGFALENRLLIEVGMRGMTPKNLETYLELAVFFNSPFLRMVIDTESFEPEVDQIVEIVNEALPKFKDAGVVLAVENHDRFKASSFVEIIERTDKRWVGLCLDTINSLGADQTIGEVLAELAPYTVNFHVKDYEIRRKSHNLGFDVLGAPAGRGMMPIEMILKELAKYNRCQSAILELWTPPEESIKTTIAKEEQWATESILYLKNLFKNRKV
ncbi:sugar phosphate isomerase/epimerase family protein [Ulvibacterium sp.]|uniref:sugar phosphate isomerase/epimerase family protein n=1 Tax=Ulvibacterium sp. TaxID=2665914 RepID=UPI003BAA8267